MYINSGISRGSYNINGVKTGAAELSGGGWRREVRKSINSERGIIPILGGGNNNI